jgi:hypothetical protein
MSATGRRRGALRASGRGAAMAGGVLHIGLILWLWYVVAVVGRHLRDASTAPAAAGG